MRITFLAPADDLSGGLRVVAHYARELQARGHNVTIVGNAQAKPSLAELLHGALRGKLWGVLKSRQALCGHLANVGVPYKVLNRPRQITASDVPDGDVVIATWWETAAWMHELPASKGRPVHLIQGYEIWWQGADIDQVNRALLQPNLKVVVSSGLKREIESKLGPLPIHVIPNAIDNQHFDAPPRRSNRTPTVGFVYSRDPIKAADRYFATIEQTRKCIPDLQVLAFGSEQPSAEVPLPEGAIFIHRPSPATLPALYARCDAWLFASRVDSFGLPILEAMACRTPVIGLPVGAAPDLLSEGHGILVSAQTEAEIPIAMATALVDLLRGPEEKWDDISKRAYQRAHAYSWHDAAERLDRLLTDWQQVCKHTEQQPTHRQV